MRVLLRDVLDAEREGWDVAHVEGFRITEWFSASFFDEITNILNDYDQADYAAGPHEFLPAYAQYEYLDVCRVCGNSKEESRHG